MNHGLEEAIGAAMAAACAFHAEPMDVKMSHAPARLYDPPNSVKIAVRPASLHERMSYPRVVFEEDSIGGATAADVVIDAQNDGIDRAPPTPIDGGSPDLFRVGGVDAAMRTYQRGIMRLSLALLRAMAIALGLPGDHFDGYWSLSNSGVTVLRYLPIASEAEKPLTDGYFGQIEAVADIEGAGKLLGKPELAFDKIGDLQANMRVYPHADGDSWFTLLSHDNVDGLQVLLSTADDEWIDVEMVAPQQIVLQVGQILQRFTNDEYRATPHRVLRPEAPCPARTTLSFFFRPSIDMPLEVPQVLRRPNDAGGVYETITVREHMALGRVAADGSALKLTSNVLRDGRWVGVRTRS